MDVTIGTAMDELNTKDTRALHDTIDSLSARGVGKIVDLPQFIVVGEQSSGKSSVLEAISRVRFPVDDGVCTRFATELVLRHATETRVDVSVKFANSSKPTKSFERTGFTESDLPDIIKEAKECMGIDVAGRDFFKDVLRLEIEGPNMYPLTLVDLPGLFHTETESQSLKGMGVVNEIVDSYMKQKNSIILAVITANKQLASQITLRKIKEHDPSRERTIGVITKPDLIRPGFSEERKYIQVAKNEEAAHKLKLGWHVLRNRAEDEADLDERDDIENEFFSSGAWKDLVEEDRGVASLRKKLSTVLFHHIRNSLPSVIDDIEKKLRERQGELDRLGKPRKSLSEKRSFLLAIASDFQRLARDGIDGRYNDAFFGDMDNQDRKLRAQLRNLNRAFDYVLTTKGSARVITSTPTQRAFNVFFDTPPPPHLQKFLQRYPYDFPSPARISAEELRKELQMQASYNQGRELPGLPNKDLAIQLFQKQAGPWMKIAEYHISQITVITKAFVDEVFTHIMGPPESNIATEVVLRNCVDKFFDRKEKVLHEKLEELLRPYVNGYAFPLDSDFHRIASQKIQDRFANRLVDDLERNCPDMFDEKSKQKLNRNVINLAISNARDLDDGEFGTDKVIDMMQSYYEMSRRTFTENVINLAIESCLICDISNILTPTRVDGMSENELEELAAESADTQHRRKQLEEEIEILRHGKEKCHQHKPRHITARPSAGIFGQLAVGVVSSMNSSTSNGTLPGPSVSSATVPGQGPFESHASALFGNSSHRPSSRSSVFSAPPSTAAPGSGSSGGLFSTAGGSSQPATSIYAGGPLFGSSS